MEELKADKLALERDISKMLREFLEKHKVSMDTDCDIYEYKTISGKVEYSVNFSTKVTL